MWHLIPSGHRILKMKIPYLCFYISEYFIFISSEHYTKLTMLSTLRLSQGTPSLRRKDNEFFSVEQGLAYRGQKLPSAIICDIYHIQWHAVIVVCIILVFFTFFRLHLREELLVWSQIWLKTIASFWKL